MDAALATIGFMGLVGGSLGFRLWGGSADPESGCIGALHGGTAGTLVGVTVVLIIEISRTW